MLGEHPAGTPGLTRVETVIILNQHFKKSPVCNDERAEGGKAVRAIEGGVRIGEQRAGEGGAGGLVLGGASLGGEGLSGSLAGG